MSWRRTGSVIWGKKEQFLRQAQMFFSALCWEHTAPTSYTTYSLAFSKEPKPSDAFCLDNLTAKCSVYVTGMTDVALM